MKYANIYKYKSRLVRSHARLGMGPDSQGQLCSEE